MPGCVAEGMSRAGAFQWKKAWLIVGITVAAIAAPIAYVQLKDPAGIPAPDGKHFLIWSETQIWTETRGFHLFRNYPQASISNGRILSCRWKDNNVILVKATPGSRFDSPWREGQWPKIRFEH